MQSLQNICLDEIIYSGDYTTIMQLPTKFLKLVDERDRQICTTKKYKKYFNLYSSNSEYSEDEYEDDYDYDSTYSYNAGSGEPWFDPYDYF